jgi:Rieske Fe-S protein
VLPQICPGSGCAPAGTRLLCPCHGSSFSIDGTVTAGPASSNLLRYASNFDGTTIVVSI